MTPNPVPAAAEFAVRTIGRVHAQREDDLWLEIDPAYRPALLNLEHFSHVYVLWWAHFNDTPEGRAVVDCDPPYSPDHHMGVFATRSEYRPNPIGLTVCPIIAVDTAAGRVQLGWIDALDGTPILDLKAYMPVCDRVHTVRTPAWLADWPEWIPEAEWSPEG